MINPADAVQRTQQLRRSWPGPRRAERDAKATEQLRSTGKIDTAKSVRRRPAPKSRVFGKARHQVVEHRSANRCAGPPPE